MTKRRLVLPRPRLRKITRAKRREFTPPLHRSFYKPSDVRALLRRVQKRRAEAEAQGGYQPFLEQHVESIRQRCRPKGWLKPARKQVAVRVRLSDKVIEEGLWLTGLKTVDELVTFALADYLMNFSGSRRRASRLPRRKPKIRYEP